MRLGVITTGADPGANSYTVAVMRGLEFGVRQINAAGGLLGEPVELVVEDDGGKPEASAAAARRLVDAGVAFAISLSNTLATMAAQEVTRVARLPHLAPCQSGKQLTTEIENPYFWHTGPASTLQVRTLVSFCKARNYETIAVVGDASQLSRNLARAFSEEIARSGLREVGQHEKPDAVVSAGVLEPELLALLKAWRGAPPALLGSYNFSIGDIQAKAGELMNGVFYVDAFDPRKMLAQAFSSLYARETGAAAGSLEGYGSDAMLLVADAIGRAGCRDAEPVRMAMQETRGLAGVLGAVGATYEFRDGGRVGFDPQGLVVRVHGRAPAESVVHAGIH